MDLALLLCNTVQIINCGDTVVLEYNENKKTLLLYKKKDSLIPNDMNKIVVNHANISMDRNNPLARMNYNDSTSLETISLTVLVNREETIIKDKDTVLTYTGDVISKDTQFSDYMYW